MKKHENFTADRIAKFSCPPPKTQQLYWDGKAPGLGIRVTSAGTKSYIFESALHGKTIRLTIGDVRTWPLDGPAGIATTARAEASRLKTLIDQGIDPRQQKADLKAANEASRLEKERANVTLSDAWVTYLEARKPKWGERHYLDHVEIAAPGGKPRKRKHKTMLTTLPGVLAPLLPIKLSELNTEVVVAWLEKESKTRPTKAALAYRLLRAFLRWCEDELKYAGIVSASSYAAKKVREAIPSQSTKEGDCLQREQLRAWFDAVTKLPNIVHSTYLQGLLLTGARTNELVNLCWSDVDFQWQSLTIRDKVAGTRVIPLTPYLASLLSALPRRNQWVFSSASPNSKTGQISDLRQPHVTALKTAGLPHVSLHGLRRSFGTLAEWVECPTGVVAQIQGHKPSAIAEKHYRRRPIDLLRMWHCRIEAWILGEANVKLLPQGSLYQKPLPVQDKAD